MYRAHNLTSGFIHELGCNLGSVSNVTIESTTASRGVTEFQIVETLEKTAPQATVTGHADLAAAMLWHLAVRASLGMFIYKN